MLTECAIISFNRFYALDFDRVSDPLFPPLTCILREVAIAYGKTTETGIRPTRGTGCGRDRQRRGHDPARDRHDLFDSARHGAFVFVHLRVLREKLPVHGSGRAALGLHGLALELDPV